MNYNNLCVFDLETGSANPNVAEIVQVAGAIINRNTLKIVDTFEAKMRPENMDLIEDGALNAIKLTREQIAEYPATNLVWPNFVNWVNKYNKGKGNQPSPYMAPIAAGYNIIGYDLPIVRRYCQKYGTAWDDSRQDQKLFSQIYTFDLLHHMWFWFENVDDIPNLKLTTLREYMGMSQDRIDAAHDALEDVKDTAEMVIRMFKMQRFMTELRPDGSRRLQMKGSFAK